MVIKKIIPKKDIQHIREEVISRGGHVSEDVKSNKKKKVLFALGIEEKTLKEIEDALGGGITTKTAFILQAIHEKLNRKE